MRRRLLIALLWSCAWHFPVAMPAAAASRPFAYFEPNAGQADPAIRFIGRTTRKTYLVGRDFIAVLRNDGIGPPSKLTFLHTRNSSEPLGVRRLPGHSNYLIGTDSAMWRHEIPHFAEVELRRLYDEIDVILRIDDTDDLEYSLRRGRMADPGLIRIDIGTGTALNFGFDGPRTIEGILRGEFTEQDGGFQETRYKEEILSRDIRATLGPSLCFSTYLGGAGEDTAVGAVTDLALNVYTTGQTASTNFPTTSPYQPLYGGGQHDVFIAKHDSTGALLAATYLGGADRDSAASITLDPSGNIVIAGTTQSGDFPLQAELQSTLLGLSDAFVAVLDGTASSLLFSTYLGGQSGSGVDGGSTVTSDQAGNLYIAGTTISSDFPVTSGAFQTSLNGRFAHDFFVVKLSSDWGRIIYGTFLGGSSVEQVRAIGVDSDGFIGLVGDTESTDFPLRRPLQSVLEGPRDVVVTILTPDFADLRFSTLLGGGSSEEGWDIRFGAGGVLNIVGGTGSADFPLAAPLQPLFGGGGGDGFVARIDPITPDLVSSTFLGGAGGDVVTSVSVAPGGNLYLAGTTSSLDFPIVKAFQPARAGTQDGFLSLLSADGARLLLSTYFGGSNIDQVRFAFPDASGGLSVTGITWSSDLPLASAAQPLHGGGINDTFVARFDCWISADAGNDQSICPGDPVVLDGSASVGCPGGLTYRWLDGVSEVCSPSLTPICFVPTVTVDTTYQLEVTCSGCKTCVDGAGTTVQILPDPLPPDQEGVLRAVRQGSNVSLTFPGAPATSWRLYRELAKSPLGVTDLPPDATIPTFIDLGAAGFPPSAYYYSLKGLSPCTSTPGP